MDHARPPEVARLRKRRRLAIGAAALMAVVVTTVALARLKPAALAVDAGTLWIDTVKRGTMVRQVRGAGVLVPDEVRWITALTEGRVERVLVRPGAVVAADTVLLELSNPQTEQAAMTADLDLQAAQAAMEAEANDAMAKQGLISSLVAKQARLRAEAAATRQRMEQARLANSEQSVSARLDVQRAEVDRRRTMATLRKNEALGLKVRAGVAGVFQEVPVDVGQRIDPGTNLARVADPARLRAQLQIAETQVKDVAVSQPADIDTRNGIVRGHVIRINPAAKNGTVVVDVVLDEALPRGARPDMRVDGTIELERLESALYVGRPAFGQEQAKVSLFKLSPDGTTAALTQVELGRSSVSSVEIIRGLNAGDRVVLADEPTGNLDSRSGESVMELLRELHRNGATLCMVTHDPRYAAHADRTIHLFDGQIVDEIGARD